MPFSDSTSEHESKFILWIVVFIQSLPYVILNLFWGVSSSSSSFASLLFFFLFFDAEAFLEELALVADTGPLDKGVLSWEGLARDEDGVGESLYSIISREETKKKDWIRKPYPHEARRTSRKHTIRINNLTFPPGHGKGTGWGTDERRRPHCSLDVVVESLDDVSGCCFFEVFLFDLVELVF